MMIKMPRLVTCYVTALIVLWTAQGFCAPAGETPDPLLDKLEWKLELYRHEQLSTIKQKPGSTLEPFTTDGCSGGLSIGWNHLSRAIEEIGEIHGNLPPWESCCVTHDRAYHTAGPREQKAEESFRDRRDADEQLRQCVLATGINRAPDLSAEYQLSSDEVQHIYTVIANLMYRAVRLGGIPCSGLPWRWGYGWPECE